MGGCRCHFRECGNTSANSPGMHFFHFPHNDTERCQKWVKYANTPGFLKLPSNQIRNKVVCEQHFKDECFMNYKKDRLIKTAIPTIVRLDKDYVLDYSNSNNPTPTILKPTQRKHLIPPSHGEEIRKDHEQTLKNSDNESNDCAEDFYVVSTPKVQIISNEKKDDISPVLADWNGDYLVIPQTSECKVPLEKKVNKEIYSNFNIVYEEDKTNHVTKTTLRPPHKIYHKKKNLTNTKLLKRKAILSNKIQTNILAVTKNDSHVTPKIDNSIITPICDKNITIHQAGSQPEVKIDSISKTNQVEVITSSFNQINKTGGSSNKIHLFNSIKKYLNPSMAALLRMEMFGNPERDYKNDEKLVAVDLLKLGEHAYDFMRDEWRFRLPVKKEVQSWLNLDLENEDF